jgi:hypothetical protein
MGKQQKYCAGPDAYTHIVKFAWTSGGVRIFAAVGVVLSQMKKIELKNLREFTYDV